MPRKSAVPSDTLLTAIVESSADAILSKDLNGIITSWNPAAERMFGYSSAEIIGRSILTIIPGERHSEEADIIERLKRGERLDHFETVRLRKDGTRFDVSISTSPLCDADGKVVGAAKFLRDISHQKRGEAALRESMERFRTMADNISQLAWMADPDGWIFWYNQRWFDYTGSTLAEMQGWGWQKVHHPDYVWAVATKFRQCVEAGSTWEDVFPLRAKDGTFRWFLSRAIPIRDDHGKVLRWFGTNTDVTEWRINEHRLTEQARLLNLTFDAIIVRDMADHIVYWNRGAEQMYGYTAAEAVGKHCHELLKTRFFEPQEQITEALQRDNRWRGELLHTCQNQQCVHVATRWVLDRDEASKGTSVLETNTDVTDRKAAEHALRQSESKLQFLNAFNDAIRELDHPEEIMDTAARMLGHHLKASRCAYAEVHSDGDTFTIPHDFTDGCASSVGQYQLSLFGPRAFNDMHHDRTLVIGDVDQELSIDEGAKMFSAIEVKAIICCPLVKEGRLKAMMAVHQTTRRPWSDAEVKLVETVVERCWATIERARAEVALERKNRRLQILAGAAAQLLSAESPEKIVRSIFDPLSTELGLDLFFNYLVEAQSTSMTLDSFSGVTQEEVAAISKLEFGHALCGSVAKEQRSIIVHHVQLSNDPRTALIKSLGIRSYSCYPLMAGGRLLGTLSFGSRQHETVSTEDADFLRTVCHFVALAQDRSLYRHELEQRVGERTSKLQDALAELEHFSYTITHDMRAPLRAMKAFAEILVEELDSKLDLEHQDYLRRIMSSSERMDHLIQDALNYSKIARDEFILAPVDVEELLRDILNSYPTLQPPQAEISIEGKLPRLLGNEAGMTQSFSNLLNNAVKFVRPHETPRVRIWAEERGEFVRLWFEDNGIGIAPEYQERIFGMFQRLNHSYEGTGIGLALAQKVVERMCGRIGLESKLGQGCRFWLEFRPCEECAPDYTVPAEVICGK
jgi:PAS domain S-box-containing protein